MPAQWVPLPFFGPAYQNLNDTGFTGASSKVTNTYVDEANHSQKRPGLKDWVDLGTGAPVDGVFWWDTQQMLVAVSGGHVFKISGPSGSATDLGANTELLTDVPATFTFDVNRAYLANGNKIVHFTPTGALTTMADTDAPTLVSHVAFLDQYILANIRNSGQWQFSEVAAGTSWRAIDIFTAESSPDNLLALHVASEEIIFLGDTSTEFWANDGVSPLSTIKGTSINEGAASPHTFALLDRRRHWLTDKRRFIEVPEDKRTPVEVSIPINKELDALSDVSDARGFRCAIDGLPLYVLSFPNANRTWAYNYQGKSWTEWDTWDLVRGEANRWRGNAYAYAKKWNYHVVGDAHTGKLYLASRSYNNDAGELIRLTRRSGFIDHDTNELKRSYAARFKFRRAQGNSSVTEPKFHLRWRNDTGAWGTYKEGSLGAEGDHDLYVTFYSLGAYRSRQWELVYTDDAGFELNNVSELVAGAGFPGHTRTQETGGT